MKEELLKGLSEEQIAKVKACKNAEEVLKVAKEENFELTNEQLKAVSGGGCFSSLECPNCGAKGKDIKYKGGFSSYDLYECKKCGRKWEE